MTHDLRRATRTATVAGVTIEYLLLAGGVVLAFGGAFITGVWFAAIGWFLARMARASYLDFEAREAMREVGVAAVMERGVLSVPADATVEEAVEHYLLGRDQGRLPSRSGRDHGRHHHGPSGSSCSPRGAINPSRSRRDASPRGARRRALFGTDERRP